MKFVPIPFRIMSIVLLVCTLVVLIPAAYAQEGDPDASEASDEPLAAASGAGKPLRFERLTTADGLSFPSVYGILQDSRGFMWFATKYGLNKFDGMTFTVYTHDPANPNTLSDNYAWKLLEDRQGMVWIATWGGGLNKFDPVTETFTRYMHDPAEPDSLSDDFVAWMHEDSRGILWVGTENGLNRFDPATETFAHYFHDPADPNSLSHNSVETMTEDRHGNLWLGTFGGGLNRFDPQDETFTRYQYEADNPHSLSHDSINSLLIDDQNMLWIGTSRGLNALPLPVNPEQTQSAEFTRYMHDPADARSLSHDRVRSLYQDQQGILWLATSGGLNRYHPADDKFSVYVTNQDDPNSLGHNSLYFVAGDVTGALWIGTANGISKADPASQRFDLVLAGSQIHAIFEDAAGVLWVGTGGNGLERIDRTGSRAQSPDPLPIQGTTITQILPAGDGELWIAALDGGLNKCDSVGGTCRHYQHDPADSASLVSNLVIDIAQAPDGNLWIALSSAGLVKFDPQRESFMHYVHDNDDGNSLASDWTRSVTVDAEGMVWIGTENGVSQLDPITDQFTNYPYRRNDPTSLSNSVVNMIYEDSQGTIWVATNDGLNKLDAATATFTTYRARDGLPGNSIAALLEDDHGHLWVSTNNGLARFDPVRNTFRNYTELDGLQGRQFTYHAAYKSTSGELFFGGSNGLSSFYPDQLVDNPYSPPVVLTDFQLFNKPVGIGGDSPLAQHINFTEKITLAYDQSIISFEFAALNYRSAPQNQYAYQLEGVDKDWVYVDSSRRFATYTSLDPGTYVFYVKASNNDGVWNEQGTTLTIVITPPWWETWWFRGLLAIGAVAVVAGGFQVRTYAIRLRNRQLAAEVEARTADMQASEARYREMFNTMTSGVAVYAAVDHGQDFEFREFNHAAEKIEGVSAQDLLGKRVTQVFPGVVESGILAVFQQVWANGQPEYHTDVLYRDEDERPTWREHSTYRLPSGEIVAIYNDISERKQAEDHQRELAVQRERVRLMSNFIRTASQEFRTPLSVLKLRTHLLGRTTENDKHKQLLQIIDEQITYMGKLVEAILTISQLEGGAEFPFSALNLNQLLKTIQGDLSIAAEKKQIALTLDLARDLPAVQGNATRLGRAIVNLIENAIDYTPAQGTVVVRTYHQGNEVGLEITDTGFGIDKADWAPIFEPFYRIDEARTDRKAGLGLPIAQRIVKLHGGRIEVESHVGQGSIFRVTIPTNAQLSATLLSE